VQFCVRTIRPALTLPSGDASIQLGLKTWPLPVMNALSRAPVYFL
jgi:hypothetical protein